MSIKTSYKLYNGPDTQVTFIFIFQPLNEVSWHNFGLTLKIFFQKKSIRHPVLRLSKGCNSISSPFLRINQWIMLKRQIFILVPFGWGIWFVNQPLTVHLHILCSNTLNHDLKHIQPYNIRKSVFIAPSNTST